MGRPNGDPIPHGWWTTAMVVANPAPLCIGLPGCPAIPGWGGAARASTLSICRLIFGFPRSRTKKPPTRAPTYVAARASHLAAQWICPLPLPHLPRALSVSGAKEVLSTCSRGAPLCITPGISWATHKDSTARVGSSKSPARTAGPLYAAPWHGRCLGGLAPPGLLHQRPCRRGGGGRDGLRQRGRRVLAPEHNTLVAPARRRPGPARHCQVDDAAVRPVPGALS